MVFINDCDTCAVTGDFYMPNAEGLSFCRRKNGKSNIKTHTDSAVITTPSDALRWRGISTTKSNYKKGQIQDGLYVHSSKKSSKKLCHRSSRFIRHSLTSAEIKQILKYHEVNLDSKTDPSLVDSIILRFTELAKRLGQSPSYVLFHPTF